MSCENTGIRPSVNCKSASSFSCDKSKGSTVKLRSGGPNSCAKIFDKPVNWKIKIIIKILYIQRGNGINSLHDLKLMQNYPKMLAN